MIDFSKESVDKWLAMSRNGEVCAAIGCTNKPVEQCPNCGEWYCEIHKYALASPAHWYCDIDKYALYNPAHDGDKKED